MLSKSLRERIRLLPHESGRVRRSLKRRQRATRNQEDGRPTTRYWRPSNSPTTSRTAAKARRFEAAKQFRRNLRLWKFEILRIVIGLVRSGVPGVVIATRRRSMTSTMPALSETATSAPQPECIRTPMAARFMSEVWKKYEGRILTLDIATGGNHRLTS